jgi:hypothetical protein
LPDFTKLNNELKSKNNGSLRSSTGRNIIGLSILSGIRRAIVGFFVVTILSGLLIFMYFTIFGTFTEVGPQLVVCLSPIIGGLAAIIAGIRGGIKTYSKPQTLSSDDLYKLFKDEESKENFSKLTYRQRFAITEYGYLLSPENAEAVGKCWEIFKRKMCFLFARQMAKK